MSASAATAGRKRGRQSQKIPAPLPIHQPANEEASNDVSLIETTTERTLIRLRDFMVQWKVLLERNAALDQLLCLNTTKFDNGDSEITKDPPHEKQRADKRKGADPLTNPTADIEEDDSFDCSDLAATSVFQKAEELIPSFIHEWKQLDERRNVGASMVEKTDNAYAWWFDRHVRLPENFDYTTSNSTNPPPADDPTQDQVVSLDDPSRTTSYTHELWKIFRSIPTSQELEKLLKENILLNNTKQQSAIIDHLIMDNNTLNNATLSDYGVFALRMSDRLGFSANHKDISSTHNTTTTTNEKQSCIGSITWEVWKNGPAPEIGTPVAQSSRMVLEFRHDQSLWDVHQAIVEMTGDDFWTHHCAASTKNKDTSSDNDVELPPCDETHEESKKDDGNNGFFFIEGVLYTTGNTCDYVTPILEWLGSSNSYQLFGDLGLGHIPSVKDLSVQSMAETTLEDLGISFGTRYAHVHKGNIECSLLVVDMAYRPPATTPYPIVHDVWKPESPQVTHRKMCEACNRRMGTLISRSDTTLTNGSKVLCTHCAKSLQLPLHNLERLSVWHSFHEFKTPPQLKTRKKSESKTKKTKQANKNIAASAGEV